MIESKRSYKIPFLLKVPAKRQGGSIIFWQLQTLITAHLIN